MKTPIVSAALFAIAASAVFAGERSDRTYPKANCAERNANPADCVIQDGPPRRDAFGPNSPPVNKLPPPVMVTPGVPGASAPGTGVSVIGEDGAGRGRGR